MDQDQHTDTRRGKCTFMEGKGREMRGRGGEGKGREREGKGGEGRGRERRER